MTQRADRAGSRRAARAELCVLATSDLHLHLLSHDYFRDKPRNSVGLERTATLIRQMRAAHANTLLVDNGDFLTGLPLELVRRSGAEPALECCGKVVDVMNALDYDAVNLGNHDLDFGLGFVRQALDGARFALLGSNLVAPGGESLAPVRSRVMIERAVTAETGARLPLRIGLLGILPPRSLHPPADEPLCAEEAVTAATRTARALREEGADLVIALAHSGIAPEGETSRDAQALEIAALGEIDAVVAGHLHQAFPGDPQLQGPAIDHERGLLAGTPATGPGYWGSHLGVIHLDLAHDGARWHLDGGTGEALPIARRDPAGKMRALVSPDPDLTDIAAPLHARMQALINAPVGHVATPVESYLALLRPSNAVQLVQRACLWFAREHGSPRLEDGVALVASAAPFRNGGLFNAEDFTHIPAGPVTMRQAADLYPYPNTLAFLAMSGEDLAEWLERAASVYTRLTPGTPPVRFKSRNDPAYEFETVLGVSYEIDISQPARYSRQGQLLDPQARRIVNLRRNGRPVAPDDRFVVVTNSYRAAGGGGFPARCLANPVPGPQDEVREVMIAWFAAQSPVTPEIEDHWRLVAQPGSQAWCETAREACDFLTPGSPALEPLGEPAPEGFIRCRLRF